MLEHDFQESVGYWVISAAEDFRRAFSEEVAPHGITYRQCHVLGCLALHGPLSQTELADQMRIEPPTLVGILDRMERDGWLRRENCPSDRRKKLIHPTADVEPIWAKIVACGRRVRHRATRGLTAEQLAQLRQMLHLVQQNLTPKAPVQEAK